MLMTQNKNRRFVILSAFLAVAILLLWSGLAYAATGVITGKVVNIRSGPGSNYAKTGTLLKGASVSVVSQQGQWVKIQLKNGATGWVNAPYISVKNTAASTTTKPTTVSQNTAGANVTKIEVTGKTVNLRSGPGTSYSVKGKVVKGQQLAVTGSKNGWYQIQTSSGIAYLIGSLAKALTTQPAYAIETPEPDITTNPVPGSPDPGVPSTGNPGSTPSGPDNSGSPGDVIGTGPDDGKVPSSDNNTNTNINSNGIKIVLDAGHGGKDPGAIGSHGVKEKDVNLSIALKARDLLTQEGYQVKLIRSDDTFVDLYERANIANAEQANLFISIHSNATTSSSQKGTFVYYYVDNSDPTLAAQAAQRKALAQSVLNKLVEYLGTTNRGVRTERYVVVKYTHMPSILIETAYLSNPDEEALLNDPDFQARAAQAIRDGVKDYLNQGLSLITPSTATTTATSSPDDFLDQFDQVFK